MMQIDYEYAGFVCGWRCGRTMALRSYIETLEQAMKLGFETIQLSTPEQPLKCPHEANSSWPFHSAIVPLATNAERQKVWGRFRTIGTTSAFYKAWEDENIVRVDIPQLRGVAGAPSSLALPPQGLKPVAGTAVGIGREFCAWIRLRQRL